MSATLCARAGWALVLGAAVALSAGAAGEEVQRFDLEPGTELLLVEDHRVPLVHVTIEFPVGHWSPWAIAEHAEEAFDVQPYDPAGSLRARADALAVDLDVGMYSHAATISLSCLREDLEQALALVRDVVTNRDFDVHELRRWTRSARLAWRASEKEPEFRLAQARARLWFPADDPRRKEYEEPVPKRTDLERLAAVRDVVVRVPGRAIGFAGDLSRAEAERLAAGLLPRALGQAPVGLVPVLGPLAPAEDVPAKTRVAMPRIRQAFFAYTRPSLTYDDPRYPAFLVADHVLGGHFFSRLYSALRHEGGETYGAGTEGQGGPWREGYALVTFTRADNAAATEEKLREVLRRLHAEGITEEERQAAIGYLIGRRAFSRQSPAQILSRALWERRHGLPPGFRDDLVDRASRLSLAEIDTLIRDFYTPSTFTLLTVAP
jgi:predicted Zn-dependent peptidase